MARKITSQALLVATALLISGCGIFSLFSGDPISHAAEAEMLRKEGKTEEAVEEYRKHILDRLKAPTRPEEENPYFYEILIGDIYREAGNIPKAESAYKDAHRHNVEEGLVVDRILLIAEYYKTQNKYDEAFRILKENRELDPLLIDGEMDEIHKMEVEREQIEQEKRLRRESP